MTEPMLRLPRHEPLARRRRRWPLLAGLAFLALGVGAGLYVSGDLELATDARRRAAESASPPAAPAPSPPLRIDVTPPPETPEFRTTLPPVNVVAALETPATPVRQVGPPPSPPVTADSAPTLPAEPPPVAGPRSAPPVRVVGPSPAPPPQPPVPTRTASRDETRAPVRPPTPARAAPSFNCRYARSPAERMVCADPVLAAADRELDAVFEQAMADSRRPRQLRRQQDRWLAERERAAPDPGAVLDVYERRIVELSDGY